MPELPEVETIRLQTKSNVIGKTIKNIKILVPKQFIGDSKLVISQKIIDLTRTGKILCFHLSNNKFLNFHFKLTGQLLFAKKINKALFKNLIPFTKTNKMPGRTTRIIIEFADGSGLFFNDLRKFGWIKVADKPEQPKGIDILSKRFTLGYFKKVTELFNKPIKVFLLDQDNIAGIGNIYANDSLFLARIHPLRKTQSLTEREKTRLYRSIRKVISEGLEDQGSSGADEAFILPDGSKGKHQRRFLVYQREKQPCLVCKTPIKRIKHHGRSSFFCPRCQIYS